MSDWFWIAFFQQLLPPVDAESFLRHGEMQRNSKNLQILQNHEIKYT